MTLSQIENLSDKDKQQFEQTINKLLAESFIVKQNDNTRSHYFFVERHEDLIKSYLSYTGWQLDGESSLGVYAIKNKYGRNRLSLRLVESIITLILRLIYEEKRKEISLSNQIVVRIQEIQDRYIALKIRQKPLGKTDLRDTIRLLKRYNIVEILDGDAAEPETRLLVYPALLYALRVESINEIYAKLQTYNKDREDRANQ